jgi:peroxiredoxin
MSPPISNVEGRQTSVSVGDAAPDFTLKTGQGEDWRLSQHLGSVVVLLFYPQNETLVCTRQLCSVRDNWENYLDTRAVIVGISPSMPSEHNDFSKRLGLPIQLLADRNRDTTRIYARHWLFPLSFTRSVVVIDAKGVVRTRDIMLRAFRPSNDKIITDIYAARGDAFSEKYAQLKDRMGRAIENP